MLEDDSSSVAELLRIRPLKTSDWWISGLMSADLWFCSDSCFLISSVQVVVVLVKRTLNAEVLAEFFWNAPRRPSIVAPSSLLASGLLRVARVSWSPSQSHQSESGVQWNKNSLELPSTPSTVRLLLWFLVWTWSLFLHCFYKAPVLCSLPVSFVCSVSLVLVSSCFTCCPTLASIRARTWISAFALHRLLAVLFCS